MYFSVSDFSFQLVSYKKIKQGEREQAREQLIFHGDEF